MDQVLQDKKGGESNYMFWITGLLGLILAVAPYIFSYSTNAPALWTSLVIGIATIVVSVIEGSHADRQQWEYWAAAVLGVVAIIAPFAFGFSSYTTAMSSSVALGVLIAIFAGSRLTSGEWRKI